MVVLSVHLWVNTLALRLAMHLSTSHEGYTFVGILVSCVVISQAELAALVPLSGSIVRHAEYFFDPALSFAQGWNSVYSNCVSLPAEITAGAILIQYWTTISNGLWITILGLLLVVCNLMFVRVYGELEFGFAMLKIMLIVGLIIMVSTNATAMITSTNALFRA